MEKCSFEHSDEGELDQKLQKLLDERAASRASRRSAWMILQDLGARRCLEQLTFCLWGRGVELLIDQVTIALTGQVKIYASLLANVGVRYPSGFAVTEPVTAPV